MELQCGLCSQQYSQPRVLSCLHTFCLTCLESLVKKQDREGEVSCPACQQRTLLPSSDPSTLPSDPIAVTLLEVKSVEAGDATCTSCEGNSSAVCRCLDCAAFLCSNCQGAHRFMKCFKSHRLVELEDLRISDLASPVNMFTCSKHDGEALEFYCNTCDTLVCLKCTAIDHRMTSHQYVYIRDAAAVMKERLLYLLENSRKKSEEVKVQLLKMEEKIAHVEVEKTRVKGEVDKVFHALLTKLEDRQVELCQEVETLYQRQEQFLNKQDRSLQMAEQRLEAGSKFVEKLFSYGSNLDLLTHGKLVISQFDLLFKQCPGNDMKSSGEVGVLVDYHTFSNLLNRIQIKIKTVPKIGVSTPVMNAVSSPRESCGAESSNIVVTTPALRESRGAESSAAIVTTQPVRETCGAESSNVGVITQPLREEISPGTRESTEPEKSSGKVSDPFDTDVTELHRVGTIWRKAGGGGRAYFSCVAVGSNGDIYALDMHNWLIQVFNKDWKHRFTFGGSGQDPGQLDSPVELATPPEAQYLAVRENKPPFVQIFSETGQFIFKFRLQGVHQPRCMVIDRKGRFLVQDVGTKNTFPGVLIYSADGKLVRKVQCTEISQLSKNKCSLAVTLLNQILVLDHRAHCVQVYSEQGQHMHTIHPQGSRLNIAGIIVQDQNKLILLTSGKVMDVHSHGLIVIDMDGTVLEKYRFPEKQNIVRKALTCDGCPLVILREKPDIHVYGSILGKVRS
ncbi:B-box type zinc finger protein ncl-1-like [Branchiostoma floridae x Branchiostoma belcheri]